MWNTGVTIIVHIRVGVSCNFIWGIIAKIIMRFYVSGLRKENALSCAGSAVVRQCMLCRSARIY